MAHFRLLRVIFVGLSLLVFTLIIALCAALFVLLDRKRRLAPAILRFLGKTTLWVCGVRLHVENAKHLSQPGGAILMPNHSSTLDAFVFTALMPSGTTAIAKYEFMFYPVIGQVAWLLDLLFINRENSVRAKKTMEKATSRIRRDKLKVLVAPEGTRSKDGKLGPFKTGCFHMALQAEVPLIPIVIYGAHDIQPHGQFIPDQGNVYVQVLEPIDISHISPEDLQDEANRVRTLFDDATAKSATCSILSRRFTGSRTRAL